MRQIYQVKQGYIHRKVGGSDVLISIGGNVAKFNGYIELNRTAAFLWDSLKEPISVEELAALVSKEFQISIEQATQDTQEFLQELSDHDMVSLS